MSIKIVNDFVELLKQLRPRCIRERKNEATVRCEDAEKNGIVRTVNRMLEFFEIKQVLP